MCYFTACNMITAHTMPKLIPLFLALLFVGVLAHVALADSHDAQFSDIKSDEHVVFFPTTAWFNAFKQQWHVPVHGWIYEPEDSTVRKALFASALENKFDLSADAATDANFTERLNLLIADNERGKQIVISVAGRQFVLAPSSANGHFEGLLIIPEPDVDKHIDGDRIVYAAVTGPEESRSFAGEVQFVKPVGLSVISDIDDTVKISNVTNRKSLLDHTFLLDFRAVPGMAELYGQWSAQGVSFHFVSSSPWQLYAPLREFLDASGFPFAAFNLKVVRFRDETLFDLFKKGTETKPAIIEGILQTYPERKFVLVGDSGEQDPEVYAALMHKYPGQVLKAYIRNVTDETAGNERFSTVFDGICTESWLLFDDPRSLVLPD